MKAAMKIVGMLFPLFKQENLFPVPCELWAGWRELMHQLSAGERDELNCEKGKVLNPTRSIVVIYWQLLIRPQWQKYSQINMIVNVRKSLIAVSRPVGDQYVMDSIN